MKNHIVFKFIAILLCAASLMGAVGGALGVVLLYSEGLYDVTVEEMVSAQTSQDSADLADWLAKNYASTELGGASESLVYDRYGSHWFTNKYDPAHYGYSILDAEGNELLSFNPELRDRTDMYAKEAFPITGKYLHLVSQESHEEQQKRQETERSEILGSDVVLDESGSTVPAEGAIVERVFFAGADGQPILEAWDEGSSIMVIEYGQEYSNNWTVNSDSPGFLFYSPEGNLVFRSAFDYRAYIGSLQSSEIYEAYFAFPEGQVRLQQKVPVGQLYLNDNGNLLFLSLPLEPVVTGETVPETTGATVPEATEATVPETTAATLPPETVPEVTEALAETAAATAMEEASSASAIPEATLAEPLPPVEETQSTEPIPVETLPPETVPAETIATIPSETIPEVTEPVLINGKSLDEYQINTMDYYDHETGDRYHAKFVYVSLPELTVEV